MQNKNNNKKAGYTIIETMIAVSVFIVIIMAGMGALLNANLLHQKSQDVRSIIDNLSFILEDMSRNIRTGYDYHCIDSGDLDITHTTARSCSDVNGGGGISFKSALSSQWIYYVGSNPTNGTNSIFRKIGSGEIVQLTPDEVAINPASQFSVLVRGAEPSSTGDKQQPFVTIRLAGTITFKGVVTPFSLQTSVSQRNLDN